MLVTLKKEGTYWKAMTLTHEKFKALALEMAYVRTSQKNPGGKDYRKTQWDESTLTTLSSSITLSEV